MGKGIASPVEDPELTVPHGNRISMIYLGTLDNLIAIMIVEDSKYGNNVVIKSF